ncbi:taurine catabolism dioxygenase TauD [Hapalosiphon sp. MRB220]|nr:taurine catabolism dioxygenase TauD [Hapalosiphon sp. MRB220]
MLMSDDYQLSNKNKIETILREIIEYSKDYINQLTIKISKVTDISDIEEKKLFEIFNQFKFVILECEQLPDIQENLLALTKYFGCIKRHKRSLENGITLIENLGNSPLSNNYLATTNQTHLMHTDGPFEIEPPKIVAMQCERPSKEGGLSQIVYAESVYEYLMKNHFQELLDLFTYPLTITRDHQTAKQKIFVEREGRISMIFRADSIISTAIPIQLEKAFNIIKHYANCLNNQLIFKLQANQIILLDNTSVLHGRTSFPDHEDRKLNRLWFDGNSEYSHHLQLGFIPRSKFLNNGEN